MDKRPGMRVGVMGWSRSEDSEWAVGRNGTGVFMERWRRRWRGVWSFSRGGGGGGLEGDEDERLVGMEEDPNRGLMKMMKWRKWTWATTSKHYLVNLKAT